MSYDMDKPWTGETVPIDSPAGTEVIYHGTDDIQVRWGACTDPRGVLVPGTTYVVDRMEIHSYHTKVFLVGIRGAFPSGAFHTKGISS